MKKKKLKRKIKKLEIKIGWHTDGQKLLALKCNRLENEVKGLKETVKKFEANPKLQMNRQCTWCKYYDSVVNNDTIYYKCYCNSECINSDKVEMREGVD